MTDDAETDQPTVECACDTTDPFHTIEHHLMEVGGSPGCVHAKAFNPEVDTFIIIERTERRPLLMRVCSTCAGEIGSVLTRMYGP